VLKLSGNFLLKFVEVLRVFTLPEHIATALAFADLLLAFISRELVNLPATKVSEA
jgi:hypothetical protein